MLLTSSLAKVTPARVHLNSSPHNSNHNNSLATQLVAHLEAIPLRHLPLPLKHKYNTLSHRFRLIPTRLTTHNNNNIRLLPLNNNKLNRVDSTHSNNRVTKLIPVLSLLLLLPLLHQLRSLIPEVSNLLPDIQVVTMVSNLGAGLSSHLLVNLVMLDFLNRVRNTHNRRITCTMLSSDIDCTCAGTAFLMELMPTLKLIMFDKLYLFFVVEIILHTFTCTTVVCMVLSTSILLYCIQPKTPNVTHSL